MDQNLPTQRTPSPWSPTMSLTNIETVRAARLQLIDLGDEKTAALLEWALKEDAAPSATPTAPPKRDDPRA